MNKAPLERVVEGEEPVEGDKLKLADIPNLIKGNKRLEGESQEEYKLRLKQEKRLLKMRLKHGTHRFVDQKPKGEKKPFRNTEKAIEKSMRKQRKALRKKKAKEHKQRERDADKQDAKTVEDRQFDPEVKVDIEEL